MALLPIIALSPAIPPFVAHLATPLGALVATLAALVGCLVWMGLYPLRRWRYRRFPGPFGLPFLGNLSQLTAMDVTRYLSYGAEKYGSVYKVWFGTRPWVVISDPDLVRKLAVQSTARPLELASYLDALTGENRHTEDASAFFAHGEAWRRARRAFESTIIHPSSLFAQLPAVKNVLGRFVPSLERPATSGQPVDIHKALGDLMLEIIGELAYGVDFGVDFYEDTAAEVDQLSKLAGKQHPPSKDTQLGATLARACRDTFAAMRLEQASLYMFLQLVFPALRPVIHLLAHHFPDPNQRRAMEARSTVAILSRRLARQWAEAKQQQQQLQEEPDATIRSPTEDQTPTNCADTPASGEASLREVGRGIRGSSFLAAMLEGRKIAQKQEDRLSELEVVAQSITFILASYETSSNTTSLALLLLASHPEAQQRLLEEVDGVAGREISPEMLAGQLPYTEAVLKETMRLYPPISVIHRHAKADIDLGAGRVVPRGAFLALSSYNLHHDPALWPEPERFLPERFLPGGAASSAHPAAWTGFGMGARMCVGHKLAMMITKATILSLLRRYTFQLAPGQQPTPAMATGLTFGPQNGVWLRLRSRGAA